MTTTAIREDQTLYAHHVDIRPLGQDRSLLIAATGQGYEIDLPPENLAALLARCDGRRRTAEILDGFDRATELEQALAVLLEEGFLREIAPKPSCKGHWELHLIGDRELIETAASLTGNWGSIQTHAAHEFSGIGKPSSAIIVGLSRFIDGDWLIALNQHAAEHGYPWTQFHLDSGKGWLGPYVIPGRTSDYEDLLGRRRCAGDDVEGAQLRRPLLPHEGAPDLPNRSDPSLIRWMLSLLFAEIDHALDGKPCRLWSTELEADPSTLEVKAHHILPLPTRVPENWLTSHARARELVLDSRTGIVLNQQKAEHHPSLPPSLMTVRSHCTDLGRIYPWGNDLFVGGSTFGDDEGARNASLGEALERYCGNCLPSVSTIKGSYTQLNRSDRRCLDPETLILHSKAMLAQPGCPFVPFTRDTEVHWVEGRSLTKDKPCLLPLSLVYANWMGNKFDQPITNYLYTPGMAAGEHLEHALVGALRELVERDITMIWWYNAQPLPAVAPTAALRALWDGVPNREEQRVRFIHLDNPFQIPVIVAVVENTRHRFLNIGFGCRANPEEAARKALTEALTLQEGSRDLVLANSTLRRSAEDWELLSVPYRPWREDRTYMDAFRPDYRDVDDLMLQQQFFLDPRAVEKVRPILDTPITRGFDQLPRLRDDSLASYRGPIEEKGFEILFADITSPDVALTNYRVVRAIVPGLVPNMPAAFPCTGGDRVRLLPVELGWRDTPLMENELNDFPMPHA